MSALAWSQVRQWRAAPVEDGCRQLNDALQRLVAVDDELRAMGRTPSWTGSAAQAAAGEQSKLVEQLEDAVTEVSAARRAMLTAADAIAKIENAVKTIELFAASNSLEVSDTQVRDTYLLPCYARPADAEAAAAERTRLVQQCRALVEEVLRAAAEVDEDLSAALRPILAGALADLTAGSLDEAMRDGSDYTTAHRDQGIGFWLPHLDNVTWDPKQGWVANGVKISTSDEVGAGALGLSAELFSRYGRGWAVEVPGPEAAPFDVARLDTLGPADDVWHGTPLVERPSGLLVPRGTPGADPAVPAAPGEDLKLPGWSSEAGFAADPVNPPPWAKGAAKALGAAGAALTVGGAGYGQWQQDSASYPGMSTTTHLERAATTAVVEGGAAAAGGWGGAWVGAEAGATIGSVVPGPGTVIGGVVGGVIGGFVGSKAGAAVGHEARNLWHDAFG